MNDCPRCHSGGPCPECPKTKAVAQVKTTNWRPCKIMMDDSSSQPEQALRCQSCGRWTDTDCPAGGTEA